MPGASFCVWGACFFCGGVRSVPGLITGTGNSLGRLVQNIGLSSKIFFFKREKRRGGGFACRPDRKILICVVAMGEGSLLKKSL